MLLSAETRAQWAVAIVLALIAGYVDGYGLLRLGVFVSFMSGNTTTAGLRTGQGNFQGALPSAVGIAFFLAGSFFGSLLTQSGLRYSHRLIFGVNASLLAIAGFERHVMRDGLVEITSLSLAMGMMNPALSKIGGESMSLTFVTGPLKRTAGHLAVAVRRKPLPNSQGQLGSPLSRAGVEASLWSAFLAGAMIAGLVLSHVPSWALLPPAVLLICLAASGRFDPANSAVPDSR